MPATPRKPLSSRTLNYSAIGIYEASFDLIVLPTYHILSTTARYNMRTFFPLITKKAPQGSPPAALFL